MPAQPPPADYGLTIAIFIKVVTPLIGAVVYLVAWAWKKMEKNIDRVEKALTAHVNENDDVHDQLFRNHRESDAKLNELIGEHKATHKLK